LTVHKGNKTVLFSVIGLIITILGFAFMLMEWRRLGQYGGPSMIIGPLGLILAMILIAYGARLDKQSQKGKK